MSCRKDETKVHIGECLDTAALCDDCLEYMLVCSSKSGERHGLMRAETEIRRRAGALFAQDGEHDEAAKLLRTIANVIDKMSKDAEKDFDDYRKKKANGEPT